MGLPMGTYNLDLMVGGKIADSVKNVRTRPGDPIPVNFDLKDTAAAKRSSRRRWRRPSKPGS